MQQPLCRLLRFDTQPLGFEPMRIRLEAQSLLPLFGLAPQVLCPLFGLEPQRADGPIKFFFGPNDFDVLYAIGPEFSQAIDFGIFRVIVFIVVGLVLLAMGAGYARLLAQQDQEV